MKAQATRRDQPGQLPYFRTGWILGGMGILVLLIVVAGFAWFRAHRQAALVGGGIFSDSPAAPDFSLVDQNGQTISLQQYRGKVVAMTFLYTHCPDVCPAIAAKLANANRRLGPDSTSVEMLAVSVDPLGDTLPAVKKFSSDLGLAENANWHYLIGSPSQLTPVWQAFHIGSDATEAQAATEGVDHSALVYLIDPAGKLRMMLPANFTESDFVQDVHALSGKG